MSTISLTNIMYADLGENYTISIGKFPVQNSNITIELINATSNQSYPMNYNPATEQYTITFVFDEIDNWVYNIYASDNYCPTITENITGIIKVREPFYVTFRGFKIKDKAVKYENDFAYVTAEFPNKLYDPNLEGFITPLLFKYTFDTSVFHAPYIDGEATLKLWDKNDYAVRLIDGQILFKSSYTVPNVTKSHGVNSYWGMYYLNETSSYDVYLDDKDLYPYRWLFNVLLIISLFMIFIVSAFMFFVIPEYPFVTIAFAGVLTTTLIVLRIAIWIWLSY